MPMLEQSNLSQGFVSGDDLRGPVCELALVQGPVRLDRHHAVDQLEL